MHAENIQMESYGLKYKDNLTDIFIPQLFPERGN